MRIIQNLIVVLVLVSILHLYSCTREKSIPDLTTINVTDITQTSAISGGNIDNDGGADVISRGVCWNDKGDPEISDFNTSDGTGIGDFSSLMNNLEPGNTYYVRAYATNNIGTGYGNQLSFSTQPLNPVQITTSIVNSITSNSAVSGGAILSDGGAEITEKGVCWNTAGNPSVSDHKTVDGSGSGSFSSNLTGLLPATTYYIKAYATNTVGTAYGNELYFTTKQDIVINPSQIIADHTVVADFNKIPAFYINEVKKMMVGFHGQSHSGAYRKGMELLELQYPEYAVNCSTEESPTNSYLREDIGEWIGEEDWYTWYAYPLNSRPAKSTYIKNLIKKYKDQGHPLNVYGFGWCWDMIYDGDGRQSPGIDPTFNCHWYGWSKGGPEGDKPWGLNASDYPETGNSVSVDTYINATEEYIAYCMANGYPTKVIFTTGPVDSYYKDEAGYQAFLKNQYIRDYVKSHPDRILFDYADILCFDDDGTETLLTWNGKTYPAITYTNYRPYVEEYHISAAGAIRLAKAQWWMLARIAGWDGKY